MAVDAMSEEYEYIELFGHPALFTNARLDRNTVPQGWHCYDLRGSDDDPGDPATIEAHVAVNHAGTVLMPAPLEFQEGKDYMELGDGLDFLGADLTLPEFCKEQALPLPVKEYMLRPALPEEAGLFYSMSPEKDAELGAVGHIRMDFGKSGKEFWHTWWPRGPEELNSPAFKEELGQVVDQLREDGPLKDFRSMQDYCRSHGGEIEGGWSQNYGYVVETEHYRYCLRCNPIPGDYQAYLTSYDLRVQEMNQKASQAEPGMVMGGMA